MLAVTLISSLPWGTSFKGNMFSQLLNCVLYICGESCSVERYSCVYNRQLVVKLPEGSGSGAWMVRVWTRCVWFFASISTQAPLLEVEHSLLPTILVPASPSLNKYLWGTLWKPPCCIFSFNFF